MLFFADELEVEKTAVAIKELRRKLGFPDNVEFKFNKSSKKVREGYVLIQMVDMIVGSIRRSYDTLKTDSNLYKNIIKKHIQDEWLFK